MSLRERRDIVDLYRSAPLAGGVLFSVVRVAGSSYRLPGARLLALADGRTAGMLSGGCLEADLLRRAAWTVRNGAVVERFSTAFDDTAEVPYGLGCGGDIEVLAEPLDTPEAAALFQALQATLDGQSRTVLTQLPAPDRALASPFSRVVLEDGRSIFASHGIERGPAARLLRTRVEPGIEDDIVGAMPSGIFTEHLVPAQRLVIFGAGEGAKPLARLAAEMGYTVIVVDSRDSRRMQGVAGVRRAMVAQTTTAVPVLRGDAVVLMTHSYEQDRQLLAELLPLGPRFLGLLGARHRSALLLSEAAALSDLPLSIAVERTHAPVGLLLGGEGPEAVALAVIAELQQVLTRASAVVTGRRLTLQDAQRLLEEGPASSMYAQCALILEPAAQEDAVIAS